MGESVSNFAAWRIKQGRAVATVNSSIRVLRRALSLAVEWGILTTAPKLEVVSGERRRDHVVTPDEEAKYLEKASPLLGAVVTILIDAGLRPEECFRMRWENVRLLKGRAGALLVPQGKTRSARRAVPMTPRVHDILKHRWISAGKREAGWVWPAARAKGGHIVPNSIYEPHLGTIKDSGVRPFVLYSLRHTFLTRLGESGCDAWTLARLAGHSSIAVSARYVHTSDDRALQAIPRLAATGYKSGYSAENALPVGDEELVATQTTTKS
jgi:integrase